MTIGAEHTAQLVFLCAGCGGDEKQSDLVTGNGMMYDCINYPLENNRPKIKIKGLTGNWDNHIGGIMTKEGKIFNLKSGTRESVNQ